MSLLRAIICKSRTGARPLPHPVVGWPATRNPRRRARNLLSRRSESERRAAVASDSRQPIHIVVLSASLRRGSLNERLSQLAARIAQQKGATVERATMADFDCVSFDFDVEQEAGIPEPATRFRRWLCDANALVVASPEYNASMPGALKNLIDWVSRERPQPFNGKQCLLMSASPSMGGGNRGLWSLRVPLEHLGARVYPDMYSLAQAHEAFAPDGDIANDLLQKRFADTIGCFLDLVEAATHYRTIKKQWVEFLGEKPDAVTDRVELQTTAA
jgi:chromate reductase, NAD(P)H dehydrogenase (quinone)